MSAEYEFPSYVRPILRADADAYIKRMAGWPYAGLAIAAEDWAKRKYLLAREIWKKRFAPCPGFKRPNGEPMTWAERFEEMCHESLEAYAARVRAARPVQDAA